MFNSHRWWAPSLVSDTGKILIRIPSSFCCKKVPEDLDVVCVEELVNIFLSWPCSRCWEYQLSKLIWWKEICWKAHNFAIHPLLRTFKIPSQLPSIHNWWNQWSQQRSCLRLGLSNMFSYFGVLLIHFEPLYLFDKSVLRTWKRCEPMTTINMECVL